MRQLGEVVDLRAEVERLRRASEEAGRRPTDRDLLRERENTRGTPEHRAKQRQRRLRNALVSAKPVLDRFGSLEETILPVPDHLASPSNRAMLVATAFAQTDTLTLLFLLGSVGSGKTWGAYGAIAEMAGTSLYLSASVIHFGQEWDELRPRAFSTDLLVINDPVPGDGRQMQVISDLVTRRHDAHQKTIVTANWTTFEADTRPAGLPARHSVQGALGAAVISRLEETDAHVEVLNGPDLRRRS